MTSQVKSAKILPRTQQRRSAAANFSSPRGKAQLLTGLGPLRLAQQALEKVEQGGERIIPVAAAASPFLERERSIQGRLLIATQSMSMLIPSVAQSCLRQLCMSTGLDVVAAARGVPGSRLVGLSGALVPRVRPKAYREQTWAKWHLAPFLQPPLAL